MTKSKLSKLFEKAHAFAWDAKHEDNTINYQVQFGLELKYLIELEKKNMETIDYLNYRLNSNNLNELKNELTKTLEKISNDKIVIIFKGNKEVKETKIMLNALKDKRVNDLVLCEWELNFEEIINF